MPTNGMTIDSLNTVSSLTAQDEVPVWDKEASGEPTRKITAQNMTASVKTLGSLVNTSEMNDAIAQSTADVIRTGDVVNNLTNTATDKPLAAAQGKALNDKLANILKLETISNIVTDSNGLYISNYDMDKVVSAYIATAVQLYVLVRPSTNGKAVMYVYQYNGTTLVPKPNENVSINVWVKE